MARMLPRPAPSAVRFAGGIFAAILIVGACGSSVSKPSEDQPSEDHTEDPSYDSTVDVGATSIYEVTVNGRECVLANSAYGTSIWCSESREQR